MHRYEHSTAGDLLHLDIEEAGAASTAPGLRAHGDLSRPHTSGWAGTTCTWPSTITPASPSRPSMANKKGCLGGGFSARLGVAYYARLGISHPPRADRQWSGLSLPGLSPHRLWGSWATEAPLHPALHTTHQRQGRALYPDCTASSGPTLAILSTTPNTRNSGSDPLAASIQLAPASHQPRAINRPISKGRSRSGTTC